jgi:formiminotetrahydrofolate cyclodeaminase
MSTPVTVSDLSVAELLARICSNAASPGAGAAAAVALALAAACVGKAVNMTLKHRPGDAELLSALGTLQLIAREALVDGDRDAQAFKDFVRDRDAPAVEELICEEEIFGELIGRMTAVITEVAPRIQPNMAGDVVAGRALLAAARQIQQRNVDETLSLR